MTDNPLKILVLSMYAGRNANVIRDFLFSFNAYSRHDYYYVFDTDLLESNVDFSNYDVILIFWSVYLPTAVLSKKFVERISQSRALKVLFLQDEYRNVRMFNQIMNHLGIQVMFTCVAEKDHETFYPRSLIPSLQATYTVLTGYTPTYLENVRLNLEDPRPLDIGYRSRTVPYYLGDLGQEKKIVAERFQKIAPEYGFRHDISIREQDRIYGRHWVKFLKSSRFVLGTPSGASVVDFTGEILRNCEHYLALHANAPYEEVKQLFFSDVDWKVVIDTVSPRILESAALGCTMVLHEGEYGQILRPSIHYVCIKKDYSNITEVITQMRDKKYCYQLAQNAYRDLIASHEYSYRMFAKKFDTLLDRHLGQPVRRSTVSKVTFYARNYFMHGECLIPHRDHFHALPLGNVFSKRLGNVLKQGQFLLVSLIKTKILRQLLVEYVLSRSWKFIRPVLFLKDLLRISALYYARIKILITDEPFRIRADFDPVSGELLFTSQPVTGHPSNEAPDKAGTQAEDFSTQLFRSALYSNKVRLIEWDHSAVGPSLRFALFRLNLILGIGDNGHHHFPFLTELAQRFPERAWNVLSSTIEATNQAEN